MRLTERFIDWWVHRWLGIPRAVIGPLTKPPIQPPTAPVRAQGGTKVTSYVLDERTCTFGFYMETKPCEGRNAELTEYDQGLLEKRGFRNAALNRQAKQVWATGATAPEGQKTLNVSLDYAKKLWGVFSTALSNETEVQNRAKP